MDYVVSDFTRHASDGEQTTAWLTAEHPRSVIAYLDTYRDGTAAVLVRDPVTHREHTYGRRSEARARAIIERHLARLDYTARRDE